MDIQTNRSNNTSAPSFNAGNFTGSIAWESYTVFTLTIAILTFVMNSATLVAFVTDKILRKQPFSIYLVCLLISNILLVLGANLEVLSHIYPVWTYGLAPCIVYHYTLTKISACQINAHALITINRVWAVTFPISYRHFHSRKIALAICACMWLYVHVVLLPNFVPRMANPKLPLESYGCQRQYRSAPLYFLFSYGVALFVIMLAYPFIMLKRRRQGKGKRKIVPCRGAADLSASEGTKAARTARAAQRTLPLSSIGDTAAASKKPNSYSLERGSYVFLVLTFLTCSTVICCAPKVLLFMIGGFTGTNFGPRLSQTVFAVSSIQPVLDPILFTIALKELQKAFARRFRLFCILSFEWLSVSHHIRHVKGVPINLKIVIYGCLKVLSSQVIVLIINSADCGGSFSIKTLTGSVSGCLCR